MTLCKECGFILGGVLCVNVQHKTRTLGCRQCGDVVCCSAENHADDTKTDALCAYHCFPRINDGALLHHKH